MLRKKFKGFTLIEILVVIGIIAILTAAAMVAINPFRQFAQANNANRWSGVTTIISAISQKMVDDKGKFDYDAPDADGFTETDCPHGETGVVGDGGDIPTSATEIGSAAGQYDLCTALVAGTPNYIAAMPYDPQNGSYTDCASYDTDYTISCDATSRRISICAPSAQLGETICITR
jgi:prepilin-type N-terminal cleavage/methylation domain-containing protein